MEKSIVREHYLNNIKEFREKSLIKVVTGVRRCGKSVLLEQFQDELKKDNVAEEQIIYLNFEKLENEELLDYKKLHSYITERLNKNGWTYVFLDEIQMVENFQKTVDSLQTKQNVDIYITGSNAYLLSNELATLLSGRYIQIHVMPLSFAEYIQGKINENSSIDYHKEFDLYMRFGSFPQTLEFTSQKSIYDYLDSVYNTVVVKDILARGKTINEGVLRSITKFLFYNIGNEVSSVNITNTLKSNQREVSYNTVEKYLSYLKDCFIIYEAPRYDVKGKHHLKSNAKYYAVDTGIRSMLLSNKETDLGHVLENIIYLELIRREYKVSVGKIDTKEIDCMRGVRNKNMNPETNTLQKTTSPAVHVRGRGVDFVCENENGTIYVQVAASLLDKNTLDREVASLNSIKDHYPKCIITLDDYTAGNIYNGIRVIHAIDFLLGKD